MALATEQDTFAMQYGVHWQQVFEFELSTAELKPLGTLVSNFVLIYEQETSPAELNANTLYFYLENNELKYKFKGHGESKDGVLLNEVRSIPDMQLGDETAAIKVVLSNKGHSWTTNQISLLSSLTEKCSGHGLNHRPTEVHEKTASAFKWQDFFNLVVTAISKEQIEIARAAAEQELNQRNNSVKTATETFNSKAIYVRMKPQKGDALAEITPPTFDENEFAQGIQAINALQHDLSNYHRTLLEGYSPQQIEYDEAQDTYTIPTLNVDFTNHAIFKKLLIQKINTLFLLSPTLAQNAGVLAKIAVDYFIYNLKVNQILSPGLLQYNSTEQDNSITQIIDALSGLEVEKQELFSRIPVPNKDKVDEQKANQDFMKVLQSIKFAVYNRLNDECGQLLFQKTLSARPDAAPAPKRLQPALAERLFAHHALMTVPFTGSHEFLAYLKKTIYDLLHAAIQGCKKGDKNKYIQNLISIKQNLQEMLDFIVKIAKEPHGSDYDKNSLAYLALTKLFENPDTRKVIYQESLKMLPVDNPNQITKTLKANLNIKKGEAPAFVRTLSPVPTAS
ncbi:MAG: hypothetical protein ACHP9Y_04835 [Gammaproteobacteria bacterium]